MVSKKTVNDNTCFDIQKYESLQRKEILARMLSADRLYLEVGGKLSYDSHASRILPGFDPLIKLKILKELPIEWSLIYCIGAPDVGRGSIRSDTGTTYGDFAISELSDLLREGLPVSGVAITRVAPSDRINDFLLELRSMNLPLYTYPIIDNYPDCSDNYLDAFPTIPVNTPIVIVAGIASFCGKMAVCISQIRKECKQKSVYAKWETFPVPKLPLNHPIHLALDAAVAHEDDPPALDKYYFQETGEQATSYERELRNFSLLRRILASKGVTTRPSPTSSSINKVKECIQNAEGVNQACRQEIIRRYFKFKQSETESTRNYNAANFVKELMDKIQLSPRERICYATAHDLTEQSGISASAIQISSGKVFKGTETIHTTSEAEIFLTALYEEITNMSRREDIKRKISAVYELKSSLNDHWNSEVTLVEASTALICTETINILKSFKNGNMHSTKKPKPEDLALFRRLGVQVTFDTKPPKHAEYF